MITLDAIQLPDGLRWADEFDWSAVAQTTDYGLTGSMIVQVGVRLDGRPLTLVGGRSGNRSYAWMTRAGVLELSALLEAPTTQRTLTLHDGRRFTVIPRREQDGPLSVSALPIVDEVGPASPPDSWNYIVNELRFTILAEL